MHVRLSIRMLAVEYPHNVRIVLKHGSSHCVEIPNQHRFQVARFCSEAVRHVDSPSIAYHSLAIGCVPLLLVALLLRDRHSPRWRARLVVSKLFDPADGGLNMHFMNPLALLSLARSLRAMGVMY